MVNTRRNGLSAPQRSLLQLERDQIASRMSFDWLPLGNRPNQEARGINNGANLCYQNCVFQALMHQPGFLRWIKQHNTPAHPCDLNECLKCAVVRLVNAYWGPTHPDHSVAAHTGPRDIARLSARSGFFMAGQQDDALLFYNWVLDQLRENPPNRQWQPEFDTLYRLDLQSHDTCLVCGSVKKMQMEISTSLDLGVDTRFSEIEDSIEASFQDTISAECKRCRGNTQKNRVSRIAAAPKILRIQLQILLPSQKVTHPIEYPEILDLTNHQSITTLPLHYHLSSVISHEGADANGGHYIASVRQSDGDVTSISDCNRDEYSEWEFLENPQFSTHGRTGKFQVYMLSYIRDDSLRRMPPRPAPGATNPAKGRLTKELRALMNY